MLILSPCPHCGGTLMLGWDNRTWQCILCNRDFEFTGGIVKPAIPEALKFTYKEVGRTERGLKNLVEN